MKILDNNKENGKAFRPTFLLLQNSIGLVRSVKSLGKLTTEL